jgi:CubicO group peptidase (beta-lactamase class C family)
MMRRHTLHACAAVALAVAVGAAQGRHTAPEALQQPAVKVDQVFSRWTNETPGCAVGVSAGRKVVFANAYGMADLERAVRNTPATIFEAGSVSKQFTAAAMLLLARDGKLSLDDPARKYVPELPEYGEPITIKHLLQHTSGLRDWGEVAAISGWPRTTRVHTHAHVLDIVSRQRALNFAPGTDWSYSNTGYNLAAVIVSRVSGKSFAEFSRERIFEPLGMTSTSWRDDHTRIVRQRAVAYSGESGAFRINMPFENVHGNGGLLTTVGDLLKWNENFVAPKVGDAAFVALQLQPGVFRDGRPHDYAYGLYVGSYKGVPEISHSGGTAGYRAYLARYPEQHASVAVLCNASSANAGQYVHDVADLYLAPYLKPASVPPAHRASVEELKVAAGLYRHTTTGEPLTVTMEDGRLRVQPGGALIALASGRFGNSSGSVTVDVEDQGRRLRVSYRNGTRAMYERTAPFTPAAAQLADYAGVFTSDEAETALTVAVEGGDLVIRRRPATTGKLTPVYADAFRSPSGFVRFHRDASGRVTELSLVGGRVWDMRFRKQAGSTTN